MAAMDSYNEEGPLRLSTSKEGLPQERPQDSKPSSGGKRNLLVEGVNKWGKAVAGVLSEAGPLESKLVQLLARVTLASPTWGVDLAPIIVPFLAEERFDSWSEVNHGRGVQLVKVLAVLVAETQGEERRVALEALKVALLTHSQFVRRESSDSWVWSQETEGFGELLSVWGLLAASSEREEQRAAIDILQFLLREDAATPVLLEGLVKVMLISGRPVFKPFADMWENYRIGQSAEELQRLSIESFEKVLRNLPGAHTLPQVQTALAELGRILLQSHSGPLVQVAALNLVGRIGKEAAASPMIVGGLEILVAEAKDPEVQAAALYCAASLGNGVSDVATPKMVQGLARLMAQTTYDRVKRAAIAAFVALGEKVLVPEILDAMIPLLNSDSKEEIRAAAFEAIGRQGKHAFTPEVLRALEANLLDSFSLSQIAAVNALLGGGQEHALRMVRPLTKLVASLGSDQKIREKTRIALLLGTVKAVVLAGEEAFTGDMLKGLVKLMASTNKEAEVKEALKRVRFTKALPSGALDVLLEAATPIPLVPWKLRPALVVIYTLWEAGGVPTEFLKELFGRLRDRGETDGLGSLEIILSRSEKMTPSLLAQLRGGSLARDEQSTEESIAGGQCETVLGRWEAEATEGLFEQGQAVEETGEKRTSPVLEDDIAKAAEHKDAVVSSRNVVAAGGRGEQGTGDGATGQSPMKRASPSSPVRSRSVTASVLPDTPSLPATTLFPGGGNSFASFPGGGNSRASSLNLSSQSISEIVALPSIRHTLEGSPPAVRQSISTPLDEREGLFHSMGGSFAGALTGEPPVGPLEMARRKGSRATSPLSEQDSEFVGSEQLREGGSSLDEPSDLFKEHPQLRLHVPTTNKVPKSGSPDGSPVGRRSPHTSPQVAGAPTIQALDLDPSIPRVTEEVLKDSRELKESLQRESTQIFTDAHEHQANKLRSFSETSERGGEQQGARELTAKGAGDEGGGERERAEVSMELDEALVLNRPPNLEQPVETAATPTEAVARLSCHAALAEGSGGQLRWSAFPVAAVCRIYDDCLPLQTRPAEHHLAMLLSDEVSFDARMEAAIALYSQVLEQETARRVVRSLIDALATRNFGRGDLAGIPLAAALIRVALKNGLVDSLSTADTLILAWAKASSDERYSYTARFLSADQMARAIGVGMEAAEVDLAHSPAEAHVRELPGVTEEAYRASATEWEDAGFQLVALIRNGGAGRLSGLDPGEGVGADPGRGVPKDWGSGGTGSEGLRGAVPVQTLYPSLGGVLRFVFGGGSQVGSVQRSAPADSSNSQSGSSQGVGVATGVGTGGGSPGQPGTGAQGAADKLKVKVEFKRVNFPVGSALSPGQQMASIFCEVELEIGRDVDTGAAVVEATLVAETDPGDFVNEERECGFVQTKVDVAFGPEDDTPTTARRQSYDFNLINEMEKITFGATATSETTCGGSLGLTKILAVVGTCGGKLGRGREIKRDQEVVAGFKINDHSRRPRVGSESRLVVVNGTEPYMRGALISRGRSAEDRDLAGAGRTYQTQMRGSWKCVAEEPLPGPTLTPSPPSP